MLKDVYICWEVIEMYVDGVDLEKNFSFILFDVVIKKVFVFF